MMTTDTTEIDLIPQRQIYYASFSLVRSSFIPFSKIPQSVMKQEVKPWDTEE